MTTRFKTPMVAAVAALALAIAAPAFVAAQQDQSRRGPGLGGPPLGGGPGGPGIHLRRGYGGQVRRGGPLGFGAGFRELDLTDDQKAQLKTIADSHQAEFQAAGQKIGAAREGMRALMEAETIDENAIRAKSQEVAAAEAELMILNAKVRQQSLQVLTSEQQAKLKELRNQRPGPRRRGGQH